uniref:Uncharacterized protein n=1 Tax=Romanomermis culicivorax TaxID=13658 RepID=A0A915HIM2_ROMCU
MNRFPSSVRDVWNRCLQMGLEPFVSMLWETSVVRPMSILELAYKLCKDCTTATPCCGYRSCNIFYCNCAGGCRDGDAGSCKDCPKDGSKKCGKTCHLAAGNVRVNPTLN